MADILKAVEKKDHEKLTKVFGRHNDLPPNWKEITEKDFAQSKFFTYSFTYVMFKQAVIDEGENQPMQDIRMYIFWDMTGIALVRDYKNKEIRHFKFAECEHTYWELTQQGARAKGINHFGMCYHVNECTKCGHIWSYDSTG